MATKLTHIGADGAANMVDVGSKPVTARMARAEGAIRMRPETLEQILAGNMKKGDVVATARLAGIMAAKKTADLIPLCHPLALTKVEVDITPDQTLPGLRVSAAAKVSGQTGVEMEALTACTVALLTLYDMAKAVDRAMELVSVRLVAKEGGKSGSWSAEAINDQTGDA